MNILILGMGSGEILVVLIFLVIFILVLLYIGKLIGERKAYKEMLNNSGESKELNRLKKLLSDKLITQDEFNSLKDRLTK